MLFEYQQQTQRFIGDQNQKKIAPNDIIYYVNTARRHVAEITQSVRILTPISGSITSITTVLPGTGYTSATITISTPDLPGGTSINPLGLQATATATLSGGSIASITITNHGNGYYQPVVTISGNGTGASATAITSSVTTLVQGQEVYNFSSFPLGNAPGVGSIFMIKSTAIIYNNYRYVLPMYSFSTYQEYIRQYPQQYEYVPAVCAQLGQGTGGNLYMYPIASQAYSFQCDCFCLPINLANDTDIEAIPQPWTDTVPYYAAYLAKLEMQDMNGARGMLDLFEKLLLQKSNAARAGRRINPYGRWIWLLPMGLSALCLLGQVT